MRLSICRPLLALYSRLWATVAPIGPYWTLSALQLYRPYWPQLALSAPTTSISPNRPLSAPIPVGPYRHLFAPMDPCQPYRSLSAPFTRTPLDSVFLLILYSTVHLPGAENPPPPLPGLLSKNPSRPS